MWKIKTWWCNSAQPDPDYVETYLSVSIRSGHLGIYSKHEIMKGTLIKIENINDLQDPLFPLDQLLSTDHPSTFSLLFKRSISEYQKSTKSKLYNLSKEQNAFNTIDYIHARSELLICKGIGFWIIETLRHLDNTFYESWLNIVRKTNLDVGADQQLILDRLIEDVNWQVKYLNSNPQFRKRIPPIRIEEIIPF